MDSTDSALLPGLKPVLELLRSAPHRIDSVFLRKGLHSQECMEIQALCRKNDIHYTLVDGASKALSQQNQWNSGKPPGSHCQAFRIRAAEP